MWGVVPIVLDWLSFYGAVIEGDYSRRQAHGAGVDHSGPHGADEVVLHGADHVVCITGGPSTTTIDQVRVRVRVRVRRVRVRANPNHNPNPNPNQLSDHCFILTWFLAYIVYARYKWLRKAHLSGRRPRSVWTGDHDHGDREVSG